VGTINPLPDVTELLSNATEQEIRDYQNSLRKVKNRTSTDLQQNVYQNRTQFIKISKEAEKLKGEMRTLRSLMSDLTGALGRANVSNGITRSPSFDENRSNRRNANRSSLANLEAMYTTQLQSLWKNVERSQKFLPAIPGRHIIMETGHWVELDSATWKPRRPVHIIILNDHLMVASKKRKRVDQNDSQQMKGPPPTKLVAEECWPLQDIDLIDLGANLAAAGSLAPTADERSVNSAINVRYGSKTFTYRHERGDSKDKNSLLNTFRKTVEDLRKSLRTEVESSARPTDSRTAALDALTGAASTQDSSQPGRPLSFLIEVEGKQQNLRWVESQFDELDIEIALHRFESAVSSIERLLKLAKGLKNNPVPQDLINSKVSERNVTLAAVLSRLLSDSPSAVTAIKNYTSWLSRLNLENLARESYLSARSSLLTTRAAQTTFTGPLPIYVFQLTHVYFMLIKNTITTYQACFPPAQMSSVVKWSKEQLEQFNMAFVRQIGNVEVGGETWSECLAIVREGLASLKEVGVDFGGLVGKGVEGWEEVEGVRGPGS
jgi:exocyst complex component 8